MDKLEKLAKTIFDECEKDGEPITMDEALEMAEMEIKAKGIKNYVRAAEPKAEKAKKKPRTVKISAEKAQLFNDIYTFLSEKYNDVEIIRENKLIFVQIADKKFKIDLIQARKQQKQAIFTRKLPIFCAFFLQKRLDKRIKVWYNGGSRTTHAIRNFCQQANSTNFSPHFCAFCQIDFSRNQVYN